MTKPTLTCPYCGSTEFDEGFVDDVAQGRVRWVRGAMEIGMMGNAKRSGRAKSVITARRCRRCSRLELFAPSVE